MEGAPTNPRHILIIDDDPDVAFIMSRVFRADVVTVCGAGGEGLQAIADGLVVDVLICDLSLPDTDGVTLFTQIHTLRPALLHRTVFVSGGALSPAVEHGLARVGCPVLSKPFTLSDLMAQVQQLHQGDGEAAAMRQIR